MYVCSLCKVRETCVHQRSYCLLGKILGASSNIIKIYGTKTRSFINGILFLVLVYMLYCMCMCVWGGGRGREERRPDPIWPVTSPDDVMTWHSCWLVSLSHTHARTHIHVHTHTRRAAVHVYSPPRIKPHWQTDWSVSLTRLTLTLSFFLSLICSAPVMPI